MSAPELVLLPNVQPVYAVCLYRDEDGNLVFSARHSSQITRQAPGLWHDYQWARRRLVTMRRDHGYTDAHIRRFLLHLDEDYMA